MATGARQTCALCLAQSARLLARPARPRFEELARSSRRNLSHFSSTRPDWQPARTRRVSSALSQRIIQRRAYTGGAQSPIIAAANAQQQDAVVSAAADTWLPFLPSLSTALHALPETLHISGPYATSVAILLLTVALRSTITLPITFWQKRSMKRMTEKVLPEFKEAQRRLPVEIGRQMARRKASMAEYKLELNKEARNALSAISKKHNYNPTLTLLLPLLVNVPLFLLLSAIIRHGCVPPTPWTGEIAPFPWAAPSAELQAQFAASAKLLADRGLDAQQVAMMAPKAGPSLIEKDPTGLGPVLFGMVTLLSVELGTWRRRRMDPRAEENKDTPAAQVTKPSPRAQATKEKAKQQKDLLKSVRQSLVPNLLRGWCIALIPIAMHVPSVLLVYWLSTTSFTLVQNIILALLDRKQQPAAKK